MRDNGTPARRQVTPAPARGAGTGQNGSSRWGPQRGPGRAARLRQEARAAMRAGQWQRAAEVYERLLSLDPGLWRDAQHWADALIRLDRTDAARGLLLVLAGAHGEEPDVLVMLGRVELLEQRPEQAVWWLDQALTLAPWDDEIAALLAEAHLLSAGAGGRGKDHIARRLAAIEAEIALGDEKRASEAADLAIRVGDMLAAERWLARSRDWALNAGALARREAAQRSAEFFWNSGRWAEALPFYLEAESHLARARSRPALPATAASRAA